MFYLVKKHEKKTRENEVPVVLAIRKDLKTHAVSIPLDSKVCKAMR